AHGLCGEGEAARRVLPGGEQADLQTYYLHTHIPPPPNTHTLLHTPTHMPQLPHTHTSDCGMDVTQIQSRTSCQQGCSRLFLGFTLSDFSQHFCSTGLF